MFEFVTGKKQKKIIKNEFYKENLIENTIALKKTRLKKNKKLLQHCVAGASGLVV